jgi:hypothetical protein
MRREGNGKRRPAIVAALLIACAAALLVEEASGEEEPVTELSNGFTATHSGDSPGRFEPFLFAPNGVFALGFLRVGTSSLDLAVVHLPSSFPLWRATPARVADWSSPATLSFDGRLVLTTGRGAGTVLWTTSNAIGDTVALLNSSELVIRFYDLRSTPWRSFDSPSDTLVLGQNFTLSSPPLISQNRRFALRLGKTYMALYMEFYGGRTRPMYWQHTALMAQPENGTEPPVYGRLDGRGFFGLYLQGSNDSVDTLAFDTFVQNLTGAFRRMTLDDDGNLRAYYWTAGTKAWTSDYQAISGQCELPTSCGAYSLCVPGEAARQCQCLVNSTTGGTTSQPCAAVETTDLCSAGQMFDVVRRSRVSLAYKERVPFEAYRTAAECETSCAADCTCWGAVYNGASGYCYIIGFPVETLVYEADDRKVGYFKVRRPQQSAARGRAMSPGATAATVVLSLVLAVAGAYVGYWLWERRRRRRAGGMGMEQELTPRPYRDLKSMDSSNNSFKT